MNAIVGSREVRRFPRDWKHPKDAEGRYVPLLPAGFIFEEGESYPTMPDVTGLAPEDVAIAAYETTTEGTPISPAFPDTGEGRLALVRYCAEHCTTFGNHRADVEAWAAILFGDAAVVLDDGRVIAEG